MRTAPLVALLLALPACRIETAASGRPPGPPTAADSLALLEQDSAARAQVTAVLGTYYQRVSARNWPALRQSFWPNATITARWSPQGARGPDVVVQTLDEFLRRAPERPGRLAVFREAPVHTHVHAYGDLAAAWVVFRATRGAVRDRVRIVHGVDVFHLLRHDGQWRIVSLASTPEVPGWPLVPRDSAAS